MPKRNSENERMLQELLETATGLNAYGVMTKQDMARINLLCQTPLNTPRTGSSRSGRALPG